MADERLRLIAAQLPEAVHRKAELAGVSSWVQQLPALLGQLEARWDFTLGSVLAGGTEAFVAEVARPDGQLAVLKVLVPHSDSVSDEITALRLAAGDGCAVLLDSDVDENALLIERLGPAMCDLDLPIDTRHQILCRLAEQIWRPAPTSGLPTGADVAERMIAAIPAMWDRLGRPCTPEAISQALEAARSRRSSHDAGRAVLAHGDVHQWNALSAGATAEDGFKLVDPDGYLVEPEYDLGTMMAEDPVELATDVTAGRPFQRAERFASMVEANVAAIWEWGVAQRVATGLVLSGVGLQSVAQQMLATADLIAERVVTT